MSGNEAARYVLQARDEQVKELAAENDRLRAALIEARPYVYGVMQENDGWRAETASGILERIDAALAMVPDER